MLPSSRIAQAAKVQRVFVIFRADEFQNFFLRNQRRVD